MMDMYLEIRHPKTDHDIVEIIKFKSKRYNKLKKN